MCNIAALENFARSIHMMPAAGHRTTLLATLGTSVSQQYFADPPRAHSTTGSQSGSAAPGQHMYLVLALVGYSIIASEVVLSQRTEGDRPDPG